MPLSTASSGGASAKRSAKEDIGDLLKRFNLQQEEEDEFVWEEEDFGLMFFEQWRASSNLESTLDALLAFLLLKEWLECL